MEKRFIRMNIPLSGFLQGQQWRYDKAPATVRMWLEKKCILFETRICSLVIKNGESFKKTKTFAEINQAKMDEPQELEQQQKEVPKLIKPIKPKNQKRPPGRPKGSGKVKMKQQRK